MCAAATLFAQVPATPQPQGITAQVPLQEAKGQMAAGDFKQAAALLNQLLATDPGSAAAHEMLAYSYLRLDDPQHSLLEYTKAAAIEHPSAVDLQNVAKDYVLLGDTTSAEHWMTVAIKMNDRDPEAWYGLGRIRFTQQHFQAAADCFQRSLVLLPHNVKAENNLGLAYEGLNRVDDAVAAYRQAIAWQQNAAHPSEQPLLNLGILMLHQDKLKEAQSLLTQAVAIAPKDPRIREQLGHLYLQLNLLPQAQQQLEAAIALEPKTAALHFLLGKVYHLQGQEAKAKVEFKSAADLNGYHSTAETD
jgi:Flp pilus assembly protein TadD